MPNKIVVRSMNQPYIAFTILLVPVIILLTFAAAKSTVETDFYVPLLFVLMLVSFYYYFYSLRLILTENHIIYKAMWRSDAVPLSSVISIKRGTGPFGVGATWVIHSTDHATCIVANVTNFRIKALREFSKALFRKTGTRVLDSRL